jgi:dTDP-4-dehydrorhamnose 3,5-epimerase
VRFERTEIDGCHLVALEPRGDERGFFARAFCTAEFRGQGLEPHIEQINLARSEQTGTTRGLHWQTGEHAEAKLVRCIGGRVFDVCVDVRAASPTFGRWVGIELSADNHSALFVPPGCAHGYQTLEAGSELLYTSSAAYAPEAERGARWDDPTFGIIWPLAHDLVISAKDLGWPAFSSPD